MDKLNFYTCDRYSSEVNHIIQKLGFEEVNVISYPSMCDDNRGKTKTEKIINQGINNGAKGIVLCSKYCPIQKLIPGDSAFEIQASGFCFNLPSEDPFIQYITAKGGYVVASGWIHNWRERIEKAGFNQETAKRYYHDLCNELVYLDSGANENVEQNMKTLSVYLELPYKIVPFDFELIKFVIEKTVLEWQLKRISSESTKTIAEVRTQCAEYSAILDLIGKISSFTNKRDTIEKIKEIFLMVFGARQFKYWNNDFAIDGMPEAINDLLSSHSQLFLLTKTRNGFCIKIEHNDKIHGVIEVSDFFFPQYMEKYLNFSLEIAKVSGLVLSNIEQYEKLAKSEKELQFLSFHDSLTGLYNRTYLNEILTVNKNTKYLAVFMFDIDKLKYVNDNFGHADGDKLICSVSDILKKCFRETDTVARIGGDEFLSILPECDIEMANTLKDRINEAILVHNNTIQESHLKLSLSIGFAISADNSDTLENIMKKADELMYVDKVGKRG